jgi:hypothetical protein
VKEGGLGMREVLNIGTYMYYKKYKLFYIVNNRISCLPLLNTQGCHSHKKAPRIYPGGFFVVLMKSVVRFTGRPEAYDAWLA